MTVEIEEILAAKGGVEQGVAAAGGAVQWLEQRIAAQQELTAPEALAWLQVAEESGVDLAPGDLESLADATSVGPWRGGTTPSVTVLSSNGTAGGTAAGLAENNAVGALQAGRSRGRRGARP